MASCASEERHTQLASPLLQRLDNSQNCLRNKAGSSDARTKARSCVTFGNFPAYYRARSEFCASCRSDAVLVSDFQQLHDAIHSFVRSSALSQCSEGAWDTGSGASSEETQANAPGTTGARRPVDPSSLYDLDWRLGSVADFNREVFAGKDVLDLGCNTGRVSFIVASFMCARRVLGADIDATLICRARAELRRLQRRYGRTMVERGPIPPAPDRRLISDAADKTSSPFCSDVLFAQSSCRKKGTTFLMSRSKQKASSSVAYPVDATHEGSSHYRKKLRRSRYVLRRSRVEGLPSEKTTLHQSSFLDRPPTSATMAEGPGHERVLIAKDPSISLLGDFKLGPDNATVTGFQSGRVAEPERSDHRDAADRGLGFSFLANKADISKGLCDDTEAPRFSSRRTAECGVGGACDEPTHYREEHPECLTPHRKCLTHNSRPATPRCAFPYNVSFCVADALSGRPWHVPTICRNTCGSDTASDSCFCGLTGEIRQQQAQLSLGTSPASNQMTKTDFCDGCSEREDGLTADDTACASLEWEKLKQAFDVVICFSLTKWIHLHHGDKGIMLLFARLHALLKDGGLLLLEPQDWASYRRARRACASFKRQLKCIRLSPRMFCSLLTRNRACSCSGELIFCGGELCGKESWRVGPDEASGPQRGHECPLKTADSEPCSCPSHGYPFRLLAMLNPWSDLEKNKAQTLMEANVVQGGSKCAKSLRRRTSPRFSGSGDSRKSVLNSKIRRSVSESAPMKVQDEGRRLQTCFARRTGAPFSTRTCEERTRESSSGALDVGEDGTNVLQMNGDERSTRELEAGEQDLPLRQESAPVCLHVQQCRSHSVLEKCGCEGHVRDSSQRSAAPGRPCSALAAKRSELQCCTKLNSDNLQVCLVHEAARELRHSRWETSQDDVQRGTPVQMCTSFVVSHGGRRNGEDEAIHVQMPKEALSNAYRCCELQGTYADEVTKIKEHKSLGFAQKLKGQDMAEGIEAPQVKRVNKSEGTLGSRFVYVLQKMSSDFTLCCKQLRECAHPKAACKAMRLDCHVSP